MLYISVLRTRIAVACTRLPHLYLAIHFAIPHTHAAPATPAFLTLLPLRLTRDILLPSFHFLPHSYPYPPIPSCAFMAFWFVRSHLRCCVVEPRYIRCLHIRLFHYAVFCGLPVLIARIRVTRTACGWTARIRSFVPGRVCTAHATYRRILFYSNYLYNAVRRATTCRCAHAAATWVWTCAVVAAIYYHLPFPTLPALMLRRHPADVPVTGYGLLTLLRV